MTEQEMQQLKKVQIETGKSVSLESLFTFFMGLASKQDLREFKDDINSKITKLDTRIDKLDTRIDNLDTRIDNLDKSVFSLATNQKWIFAGLVAIFSAVAYQIIEKI